MTLFYHIIGVVGFLSVATIVISYMIFRMAFYSDRSKKYDPYFGIDKGCYKKYEKESRELIDNILSLECERVYIRSRDGLMLSGRYYHVKDGAPLEIQCHGYKSTPMRDFSGSGKWAYKVPYNMLLIDQRAHGESEGKVISFGINERFDLLEWIKWSIDRFGNDVKIILYGISMGAATVLMAAGENLPENVRGVVADCPYSSALQIIKKVARDMGYPPKLATPFIILGAKLFGGFSINSMTPLMAVKKAKLPILLVHGEADGFVPCDMSREIARANENIIFETFPGADHGISYFEDQERYISLVHGFVESLVYNDEGENNESKR